MARFLSPEWIDQLNQVASESPAPAELQDVSLSIAHVVEDAPDGVTTYRLAIAQGAVQASTGDAAADVTFRLDYDTAAAIAQGQLSPLEAVMGGRLKMSGGVARLMRHGRALAALEPLFGKLRDETTY